MSHTSEVKAILISDIVALEHAVTDLQNHGVRCRLVKDATPRAFFKDQKGLEKADYVLVLEDCPYDVGFYRDGKGYVARTDFYAGHVARVLGTNDAKVEDMGQRAMGKLYSAYAVAAATRKAVSQGMSVRRIDNTDGSVRLVVNL